MDSLHKKAVPVHEKGSDKPVGWIYNCAEFSYEARENPHDFGSVSYYIEWSNEDTTMGVHPNWIETQAHLQSLIQNHRSSNG